MSLTCIRNNNNNDSNFKRKYRESNLSGILGTEDANCRLGWGITLGNLENREDIWQVVYREVNWKQYQRIVIVPVLKNGTTIWNPGTPN